MSSHFHFPGPVEFVQLVHTSIVYPSTHSIHASRLINKLPYMYMCESVAGRQQLPGIDKCELKGEYLGFKLMLSGSQFLSNHRPHAGSPS